ncbi:MAG TPA: CDP-diacylglycerol--glycerol-3-phosphate 3-phosphatidyltransferase [Thermoguttaceae bacterium]|nr:CDP-diacylglycerol--glycerol-3-phosphate 3-phosphatidyltransferase [Thermoguttaceae bacterium]
MSSQQRNGASVFNLPNQLTSLRLVLAVIMFCLIPWGTGPTYVAATVLFLLAAGTDWLDGYFARKYNLITTLGRILDPFADKVIVCGTFIFLVAVPEMADVPLGLRAWMVVAIVARELLVTALRSVLEERGTDFSAKMSGKLKMVLQCIASALALFYLSVRAYGVDWSGWLWLPLVASIWAAVILTIYSGLVYVHAAVKLLRKP